MKLENLTFRGGTSMEEYKELSCDSNPTPMPPTETVILSMSQGIGAPAKPIVAKGDKVKLGQKIAEAGGFISAPVHASVSGEVVGIVDILSMGGGKIPAIVIQNDGLDTVGYEQANRTLEELSPEDIVQYVKEAGIVGMGGAGFPTCVKLQPGKDSPVDTVIINGAECEPYLTCDDVTMRNEPEKVVKGLELIMKAVGAKQGFVAIEDNKPGAIAAIDKVMGNREDIKVGVMKTKYPQGDEKRIITSCTGRDVPAGALPASVGCLVENVGTTCAIVDACCYGKPLYERIVTVTGHALNKPQNLIIRFGTRIRDAIEYAGGLKEPAGKVIFGGPMMGIAQPTMDGTTCKNNNGILVLTQDEGNPPPVEPCIRCGRCVDVCPVFLEPLYIATASKAENWEVANDYHCDLCIECGTCSFICPANRPLTELIRFGKRQLKSLSQKKA